MKAEGLLLEELDRIHLDPDPIDRQPPTGEKGRYLKLLRKGNPPEDRHWGASPRCRHVAGLAEAGPGFPIPATTLIGDNAEMHPRHYPDQFGRDRPGIRNWPWSRPA